MNEDKAKMPDTEIETKDYSPLKPMLQRDESIVRLLAGHEEILRLVEQTFPVKIYARGEKLSIKGEDESLVSRIENLLMQFADLSLRGQKLSSAEVRYGLHQISEGEEVNLKSLYDEVLCVSNRGKPIRPFTNGQKEYAKAIRDNDITFAIGPAGTGKTYLAVAQAVADVQMLRSNRKGMVEFKPLQALLVQVVFFPMKQPLQDFSFLKGEECLRADPFGIHPFVGAKEEGGF